MPTSTHEQRVRRQAKRLGFLLRKSRRQNHRINSGGDFMLIQRSRGCVMGSQFEASLPGIEKFLKSQVAAAPTAVRHRGTPR